MLATRLATNKLHIQNYVVPEPPDSHLTPIASSEHVCRWLQTSHDPVN